MLHYPAISGVWVQSFLFYLFLIGNAVMHLERMALWRWKSRVVDFLFYLQLLRTPLT